MTSNRNGAPYSPQQIWDYTLPQPGPGPYDFATGSPIFSTGAILIPARAIDGSRSVLYSVDTQTKQLRWSHFFEHTRDLGTPCAGDGVVYVRDIGPGTCTRSTR